MTKEVSRLQCVPEVYDEGDDDDGGGSELMVVTARAMMTTTMTMMTKYTLLGNLCINM